MRLRVIAIAVLLPLVVNSAENRETVTEVVAGATVQQMRNAPHEWGSGAAGFAKRVGSGFGTHFLKIGIAHPVAALRHEELGYHRLGRGGAGPRLKYALLSTVITRKTTTGRPTAAVGRISGAAGSSFISHLWMPARLHTVSAGVSSTGISLGVDAGTHVVQEFWPEIRHPHKR